MTSYRDVQSAAELRRSMESRNRVKSRISSRSYGNRSRVSNVCRGVQGKPSDDIPVLSYQSLLTFAMFIKEETAENLALKLGIPEAVVDKLKERLINYVYEVKEPTIIRTFHILWYWRGRMATRHMVEQILSALRDIGKWELAAVINTAYKEKRRVKVTDFTVRKDLSISLT